MGDVVNRANTTGTGTVWDFVEEPQPVYQGSVIPKSFELTTSGGQKFWVHPNATKHIAEFAQMKAQNYVPDTVRMATQAELTSFKAAVESAIGNGINYNELMMVGGWELKFRRPRQMGALTVIIHARVIR
jgi:filamentous hemagglutinin